VGLPAEFIPHGSREILLEKYGLTAAGICRRIKETIKTSNFLKA
jgi:deoxyxylulose-5-phosphate synthase